MPLSGFKIFFILSATKIVQGSVALAPYLYHNDECVYYWNQTVSKLLVPWERGFQRSLLYQSELTKSLGHTPLHLRVKNGTLYCVQHMAPRSQLRVKKYRAYHYINRINRILRYKNLPQNLEWWTHQSDLSKIRRNSQNMARFPPIFSVAGGVHYLDIPGIPFMSFSDKSYLAEQKMLRLIKANTSFSSRWKSRKSTSFFLGSLSDCGVVEGSAKLCSRAKVVLYAARSKDKLFTGVGTTTDLNKFSSAYPELYKCSSCEREKLESKKYIEKLFEYKYLLNFNGAGNWSRRLSTLFASGGAVFQAESSGYQFYELGLEPGVHYIPFDIEDGIASGNLRSRLEWAMLNDARMKEIAIRSESFEANCLQEVSIDYFVYTLLTSYEKLLQGSMKDVDTINLSSCIVQDYLYDRKIRVPRVCEVVLDRCWAH